MYESTPCVYESTPSEPESTPSEPESTPSDPLQVVPCDPVCSGNTTELEVLISVPPAPGSGLHPGAIVGIVAAILLSSVAVSCYIIRRANIKSQVPQ